MNAPPSPPTVQPAPIELAVVIPTYNERENVAVLLQLLERTLAGIEWEAIFVDDNSPDGTAEEGRTIASTDRRIRILERLGRRGLSSACIEGMLATPARYIAVMDADLQHDETILPRMLELIRSEKLDVVVGSRHIGEGSMGNMPAWRVWLSRTGAKISQLVCRCQVTDAMSGFFIVDRQFFRGVARHLTGTGFKILLDILASSPRPVRLGEVAYRFRTRRYGESKLDIRVELEYLYLIVDKLVGSFIPTRFVLYVLVGFFGLAVHLSVLAVGYRGMRLSFVTAQVAATVCAMTVNFLLNNAVTFRSLKLAGLRLVIGLLTYYVACSIGALINVSFAGTLLDSGLPWYVAGIVGMAISSVWNYGVNTVLTWRRGRSAGS